MEFVPLGTQVGFNPRYLGSLWQALAKLALHVPVPISNEAEIELYGAQDSLLPNVSEALVEIKRISKRTMLSSGLGEEVSFTCECGQVNKRRSEFVQNDQILSCIAFECNESYMALVNDGKFEFERRAFSVECGNETCSNVINIPKKDAETLKRDDQRYFDCDCENRTFVRWSLTQSRGTFSTASA